MLWNHNWAVHKEKQWFWLQCLVFICGVCSGKLGWSLFLKGCFSCIAWNAFIDVDYSQASDVHRCFCTCSCNINVHIWFCQCSIRLSMVGNVCNGLIRDWSDFFLMQIRWTKTAGSVSDRFQDSSVFNETLHITKIQRHQGGRYYCKAENGLGSPAIKSIRVDVYCELSSDVSFIMSCRGIVTESVVGTN